jgi:hypothetical protein
MPRGGNLRDSEAASAGKRSRQVPWNVSLVLYFISSSYYNHYSPMSDTYEESFESDVPSSSPRASEKPAASPRAHASRPHLTFPGLKDIALPYVATKPHVSNVDASGEARDKDTLIITRQHRGIVATTERNSAPSEAQMSLRDFSAYHPQPVKKWNKNYLNELAYAETRCVT